MLVDDQFVEADERLREILTSARVIVSGGRAFGSSEPVQVVDEDTAVLVDGSKVMAHPQQ